MMKRLLFTSAIALFSVITFAQNGNYSGQRTGQANAGQQSGYQRNNGNQTTRTQPVVQPASGYNQSNQGNYNNGYAQNTPATNNNNTRNQPYNSNAQSRDFGYNQAQQRQGQRSHEQDEYNRRYAPVYHQMQYRRDFHRDQYRGHGYYDIHGNFCY